MSDTAMKATGKVLHVRPHPGQSGCADDMDELLAASCLHVDTCSDVYRGLARLCRSTETAHQAVIVCMDGLGAAELEFFSVVASRCTSGRPQTPTYVYGGKGSRPHLARAIELGANGEATEKVIRTLAAAIASPTSDSRSSDRPSTGADMFAKSRACHPVSDEVAESNDEDVSSGPVRVPWLRHDDRPVRTGPQERDQSRDTREASDPAGASSAFGGAHKPLLTEEELQALLGDETFKIAPEGRNAAEAGRRDGGGGFS